MKIINLTPHDVVIVDNEGKEIKRFPKSGDVAIVKTKSVPIGELNGVPVVQTKYEEIEGLPDPQEGTAYIASVVVAQALNGARQDVYAPDTNPGSVVRDDKGNIIGVKRLTQV